MSHYREFGGLPEDDDSTRCQQESVDSQEMVLSPKFHDFSYGTSPGYQKSPGGALTTSAGICIL